MASGSLLAGIEAILAGIQPTSDTITRFIRSVRASHADLATVTRELSELRLVLDLLANDVTDVPAPLRGRVLDILEACANILACLGSLLSKYSDGMQWAAGGRSEVVPLRTSLETYRGCLALVLEVVNLEAAKDNPAEAQGIRDQTLAEIASIRGHVPHVTEEDNALHVYLDNITAYTEEPHSEMATSPQALSRSNPSSPAAALQTLSPPSSLPITDRPRSSPSSPMALAQIQQSPKAVLPSSPPQLLPAPRADAKAPQLRHTDTKPLPFRLSPPSRRQTEPMPPNLPPPSRSPAMPVRRETGPAPPALPIEQAQQPPPEVISAPAKDRELLRRSLPAKPTPRVSLPAPPPLPFEGVGPWYPREDLAVPFYQHNNNPTLPFPPLPPLPPLPPPPNRASLGIENRKRYSSASQISQVSAQLPPPKPRPALAIPLPPVAPHAEAHEVNVEQYGNQRFIPAPVVFENRVPSASSNYGQSTPSTRDGSFQHAHRVSDASVPATPMSAYSSKTGSSNEHSHGFGSPSPGAQTFASPPTTYTQKSPDASSPAPQPNHFSRASAPEVIRRPSIDSFQLSPDPLGLHHGRSSFPGASPLPRPSYSPAPSSVYSSPSIPLAQEINPAFPTMIPPAFFSGHVQNGQLVLTPQDTGTSSTVQPSKTRLDIIPTRYFLDKEKGQNVFLLDVSPSCSVVASKHGNNMLKIWSLVLGSLQTNIKFTSYVNAQVRSREYFIRSHAILSESATLVGITTSFGHSIEVWNWTKKKKLQVIDDAHRWASVRADVYRSSWAPIAVYRGPSTEKIDLLRVSPDTSSGSLFKSKIFIESRPIELRKAGLPFIPRFPELAYSSTSPLLVAAAGPRPGDPPRAKAVLLAAWQLAVLHGEAHQLYRYVVPEHPEIQNALPVSLAVHGTICVSIWIPANHRDVASGTNYRHVAVSVTSRYVLCWDLSTNTTRIIAIPNVLSCVSPDCRLVAYCDTSVPTLAVIDIATGDEVCRWPDLNPVAGYGQLDDLSRVTEFAFSSDGRLLVMGDEKGGVGSYELRDSRKYDSLYAATPLSQWSELQ
ncbi:hypothetical protein GQ53DRAFT_806511 [Thozetella sp. PMI_491]|nr:hypothetical protein GQ53DRAFT_806511 [Thozetella sp. PMI_491]